MSNRTRRRWRAHRREVLRPAGQPFTGTPTAPTPADTDDSTKLATTAFVKNVATTSSWASNPINLGTNWSEAATGGVAKVYTNTGLGLVEVRGNVKANSIPVSIGTIGTVPAGSEPTDLIAVYGYYVDGPEKGNAAILIYPNGDIEVRTVNGQAYIFDSLGLQVTYTTA